MKRIVLVLFTAVLLVSIAIGQQPEEKKLNVFAGGGISIPVGPKVFKDHWDLGPSFGGGVGYSFMPWMSLYATVEYNNFALNIQKFVDAYYLADIIKFVGGQINA